MILGDIDNLHLSRLHLTAADWRDVALGSLIIVLICLIIYVRQRTASRIGRPGKFKVGDVVQVRGKAAGSSDCNALIFNIIYAGRVGRVVYASPHYDLFLIDGGVGGFREGFFGRELELVNSEDVSAVSKLC